MIRIRLREVGLSDDAVARQITRDTGREVKRSTIQRLRTGSQKTSTDLDTVLQWLGVDRGEASEVGRLIVAYRQLRANDEAAASQAVEKIEFAAELSMGRHPLS